MVSKPGAGLMGISVGEQVLGPTTSADVEAVKTFNPSSRAIGQNAKTILTFAAGALSAVLYFKVLNP
jgi:hypothetical protein